jgi:eukaryotic-like serine/threonine-protein kinase
VTEAHHREAENDDGATVRQDDADEPTRSLETEPPSAPPPSIAAPGGALSPLETLLAEELQRTRIFMRIAIALALGVAAVAPFLGGDGIAKAVLYAGLVVIVAGCSWLGWKIRDGTGYTETRWTVTSFACVLGVFGGIYYFGPFSPAPVALPFGLFFFSLSQHSRATLRVTLLISVAYAGLVLGAITGALADRGLVRGDDLAVVDRLVMLAIIESILVATHLIGRATRRASIEGVERHERALRRLLQREALLREARQELEVALQAGGIGRYTDVQLGSFQLGTLLGRGGMGEVYAAKNLQSGEEAAVKVLQRHLLGDADNVRRFLREAQVVKQLDAPEVVRVLEVGGLEAPTPFIAMERLRGEDLADMLRRRRQLSLRATVRLAREAGRGLEAAHAAGVVHRDIKPRNLFRAELADGTRIWKVLDFGVSKLAHQRDTLTAGGLIGTPAYMAPEQALRGEVTPLSDIYALGVICYRALTGRPPFAGIALPDTLYKVVHTMPPRPSALCTVPASIDDVLLVALAKDPSDRFQHPAELAIALELAADQAVPPRLRARAEALDVLHPWGRDASSTDSAPGQSEPPAGAD